MFEIGGRVLVLFDGHCGLCNGAVRWLVKRDREDRLRFLALQSERAAGLLARHGMNGGDLETMVVVRDAGGAAEKVLG
ncbi:MAG: thiol-disulfide oxidoreductase DCC family protein, partial [Gemmatimonadales bacterium]